MKWHFSTNAAWGRRLGALQTWPQKTHHWLEPTSHRITLAVVLASLLAGQVIPLLQPHIDADQYKLGAAEHLLPEQSPAMAKVLQYNQKQQQYSFNSAYSIGTDAANQQGGAKIQATLASDASKGISVTDPANNVTVTLTPKFNVQSAKQDGNRVYYPLSDGTGWLVYSLEADQVKEDVILSHANGDHLKLTYNLDPGDGLQARLQKDGSIGIYGSSLPINGNVSTGSAKDQKLLAKLRSTAAKNKLLFTIPAPVIKGAGTNKIAAHYQLKGSELSLDVSGLSHANYPLDIDPSVFVQSAQGLMYGNSETNIGFDTTSNVLEKAQLSGGNIRDPTAQNSWTTSSALTTGTWEAGTAVMGGFIYVAGGVTGTGTTATTTVYYAALNNDGTIGTWKSNSGYALPAATKALALIAYNDYLYVIGGNTGSATTSNVYKLHVAASGEPTPSWTAATALPAALQFTSAVAYQNQLYVLGGQGTNNTNTGVTTTYTASVKPDGTLGAWSTMTALPSALYGVTALTYNGYLYAVGGTVAGTTQNSVYYAQITSAGTIGAWQTGSTFTTGRQAFGGAIASIWAGYLYISSGCTTVDASGFCTATPDGTIQEASIAADGSLSTFTTLQYASSLSPVAFSNISQPLLGNGFVSWASNLYMVGGCATALTTGGCPSSLSTTYYAGISAEGDTGPAQATSTLNSGGGLYAMGAAINNGYVYSVGGCTTTTGQCSNTTNKVYYAKINSDGTLGAWTATTGTLSAAVASMGVAVYNNVLYTLGGSTGADLTRTGNYGAINTTTGTIGDIGSFTATGNLLATYTQYDYMFSRAVPGSTTGAGYLYVIGGCTSGGANTGIGCSAYSTSVMRCSITLAAAAPTGCATTGQLQLATGLGIFGGSTYGGYVYLAGGANSAGAGQTGTIYYATFDSSGNLVRADNGNATGGWQTTTGSLTPVLNTSGTQNTTGVRRRTSAYAVNGYLYVLAGHDGTAGGAGTQLADMEVGKINPTTGDIASFSDNNAQVTTRWDFKGVAANGFLYAIGGCSNGYPPANCNSEDGKVQYIQVYNNYSGTPAQYKAATASTTSRIGSSSAIYNGYLYNAGGCTNIGCTTFTSGVEYAPINADGTLGTWTTATNSLTATRSFFKLLANNGYLYALGGRTGNAASTGVATTEMSTLSGAVPGTWATTTSMNNVRSMMDAVTYNGYIYAGGGVNAGGTYLNNVEYSLMNTTNGTLGAWTTNTNTFATARSGLNMVAYNSTLYVLGGNTGTVYLNDVQFGQIASNGSVGAFTATESLPQQVSDAQAFAANGYLYVVGGRSAATTCTNNTYVASLTANSSVSSGNVPNGLGSWSQTSVLFGTAATDARYGASISYANGKVYVLGGGCSALTTNNYYSTLQSQPQTATYSYAIDAINDVFPSKSLFNGLDNGIGASWQLSYRSSTNANNAWGRVTNYGKTTLGTPQVYNALDGSGTNTNFARYYWIQLSIDGSQAFGYPEDVSRGPTIANMTIQFTANPAQRLRHGKTFINNVQQPLDAPF